jgi:hypothetical protein
MKIFNKIFKIKVKSSDLTLDTLVDKGLITQEEMLYLKKERAIIRWEEEVIKNRQSKNKRR